MKAILTIVCIYLILPVNAQNGANGSRKIHTGVNVGPAVAYADKAFLIHSQAGININYKVTEKIKLQFAPKYTWLIKWNEHYLTLPLHLGVELTDKISVFAGPALSIDVGYFKDLGISAAASYRISNRSAVELSAFSYTLYDYQIDFLYIPVSILYSYSFWN
jgi:hypothetical protein